MLKRLWNDPVWSKVISAAIIAAAGGMGKYIFDLSGWLVVWIGCLLFLILMLGWYSKGRLKRRWKLRAEMNVSIDPTFPHVAVITIHLNNPGHKSVHVASVEFITKEHWDMPDPLRTGYPAPVINFLPAGTVFIKISADKDSVASKALSKTIKPKQASSTTFRLVTDHAVGSGMGLFPFHLGVELISEQGKGRISMPDLIVSLSGLTVLSSTTYEKEPVLPIITSGDVQHTANAVLSRIAQGVLCAPEILEVLKKAARA